MLQQQATLPQLQLQIIDPKKMVDLARSAPDTEPRQHTAGGTDRVGQEIQEPRSAVKKN